MATRGSDNNVYLERQTGFISRIVADTSEDALALSEVEEQQAAIGREFVKYAIKAKLATKEHDVRVIGILPYFDAWAFAVSVPVALVSGVRCTIVPKKKPGPKPKGGK